VRRTVHQPIWGINFNLKQDVARIFTRIGKMVMYSMKGLEQFMEHRTVERRERRRELG
jgi:hypothetical protein